MSQRRRSRWRVLRFGVLGALLISEAMLLAGLGVAEVRAAAFRSQASAMEAVWQRDVAGGVPSAWFQPLRAQLAQRLSLPGWSADWLEDPGSGLIAHLSSETDDLYQRELGAAQVRAEAALTSLTTADAAARAIEANVGADDLKPDLEDIRSASSPLELENLASSWEGAAADTRSAVETRDVRDASGWQTLNTLLTTDASSSGGTVEVVLEELGGPTPRTMKINAEQPLDAASTFKLPVIVAEGRLLAAGTVSLSDTLCYSDSDASPGYFSDYYDGACFTRGDLLQRTGIYSDNTAANILIRDLGGPDELNVLAQQQGATDSAFWYPNTTTAADLAAIWHSEATDGAPAHGYVYPVLTNTMYESGIPAGVPAGATVVHKVGDDGTVVHDAALVEGSPNGSYILVVMTQLPAGDGAAWAQVQQISAAVWAYEASR